MFLQRTVKDKPTRASSSTHATGTTDDKAEMILEVQTLSKDFETKSRRERSIRAIDSISFSVGVGEFFTLLGPSGCGKTTTLRCIAGLESPTEGTIVVGGRRLFSSEDRLNVPVNRRGLSMVFQSYAIWPHMTVAENVAFPLRARRGARRLGASEIAYRVEAALEKVELSQVMRRQATALSGGQQQRLALARALVMEAPLTLFDEPLSNLDAKLRDGMRFELKRLQRELGITAIYVTHDQTEALAMSTRVAVMRGGKIEQVDRPRAIYERPASLFVADFIGTSNMLEGSITEIEPNGTCLIATEAGDLRAEVGSATALVAGAKVTVSVRPQHISIAKEPESVRGVGRWPGIVRTRAYLGECVDHLVEVSGTEIRVRGDSRLSLRPGTEVSVGIDPVACAVLPATDVGPSPLPGGARVTGDRSSQ